MASEVFPLLSIQFRYDSWASSSFADCKTMITVRLSDENVAIPKLSHSHDTMIHLYNLFISFPHNNRLSMARVGFDGWVVWGSNSR